jgi:hypothetical protein
MAHFAQINDNYIVENIIVVNNDILQDADGNESEQLGVQFCHELTGCESRWVQTSYNNRFRRMFAGIGFTYNPERDIFYPYQPYPSWSLDDDFNWQPPVPCPDGDHRWNESSLSWVQFDKDN